MLYVLSLFVLLFGHIYAKSVADDLNCEFTKRNVYNNKTWLLHGHPTTIQKHPWQVSIHTVAYPKHICGGSIITPDTIVTAAHCVYLTPGPLKVVTGVTDSRKSCNATSVKKMVVHENYYFPNYVNDIALIKLKEPLEFSADVQPIKLPDASLDVPAGTVLTHTGWDAFRYSYRETDVLREVQVEIEDKKECENVMKKYKPITENMVCALVPGDGNDLCQGDSGGPLQHEGTLIGIAVGCQQNSPGIYTDVRKLRSWIQQNAGV